MNLQQLSYIVEVEKTKSITWAADNLYMNQSNLSRSIREFEQSLGFDIFRRTTKGMLPTQEGEKVLYLAKKMLVIASSIEEMGHSDIPKRQAFGISVPRSGYVSYVITNFIKALDFDEIADLEFLETTAQQAVNNILERKHRLAVIRYQKHEEGFFSETLKEQMLEFERIAEFESKVTISADNPLAKKELIDISDLANCTELTYMGKSVSTAAGSFFSNGGKICLYDWGSLLSLLQALPKAYMWGTPIQDELLKKHGLVMRPCGSEEIRHSYIDALVYQNNCSLTNLEQKFINELTQHAKQL